MLVLTRREGEEIVIGEGPGRVIVRIEQVRAGGRVRVGIEAARSIPVHRREIADQIAREAEGVRA